MILKNSNYFVATKEYLRPLFVLALCSTLIYLAMFGNYFKLSTIHCVQDVGETCTNEYLLAELNSLKGENLIRLNLPSLHTKLSAALRTIRQINLSKTFPSTLNVEVLTAYPYIALTDVTQSQYLVLDETYRVIKTSSNHPNVPILALTKDSYLRLGQNIEDKDFQALCDDVVAIYLTISGINLITSENDTLTLLLNNNQTALLTTNAPLNAQISALRTLLLDATISGSAHQFDLRYAQPIIR